MAAAIDTIAKMANVQHVVKEGDSRQRAPESSPSHEAIALEVRAQLDSLRLQ